MRSEFENSIKRSSSYEKLVYQHGERLFIFDDGKYKIAAVQLAWEIFKEKQTKVDELQYKAKLRESDHQALLVKYRATKKCWEDMSKEKDELQKRVDELHTAFKQLIEMENESISFEHDLFDKGWNQSARQTIENIYKLTGLGEQALKGGFDE